MAMAIDLAKMRWALGGYVDGSIACFTDNTHSLFWQGLDGAFVGEGQRMYEIVYE